MNFNNGVQKIEVPNSLRKVHSDTEFTVDTFLPSLNLCIPSTDIKIQFPNNTCSLPQESRIQSAGITASVKSHRMSHRTQHQKPLNYEPCEILDTKEQETSKNPKSRLYQLISHFYLVKKFIGNIRNSTIYRKPKWLNRFHFNIINDWSFFLEGVGFFQGANHRRSKTLSALETLLRFFLKIYLILRENLPVLHPTQSLRVIFDCLMLFLTFAFFLIIPVNLGFDLNFLACISPHYGIWLLRFSLVIFSFDIFMSLNTAYFDKGRVIISRKRIISNYLKQDFCLDLISMTYFAFSLESPFNQNGPFSLGLKIMGLLYFLRVSNLVKILNRIEEFLFLDERQYNILAFIKLLFSILLFLHFSACIWHYVGFFYQEEEITWIQELGIYNEPWMVRYLNSLYFSAVVMNTIGFGDITPTNKAEKCVCIFLILITCTMFAYIINSIGMILQNINKESREFKRYTNVISGYLRQNNISLDLRTKIRNYLEYIWQEEKISNVEEAQEIINKRLSKSLKDELILSSNGAFLKNIPLLIDNFSEETLNRLSYEMKECNLTPGEIIYTKNTPDDFLYIIRKGKVELYLETQKRNDNITLIKTLRKGDLVGEISFFRDTVKETSARSVTFTSLYSIKRENFINAIKKNNKDFEHLCKMRDQMNLYENYEGLSIRCSSCKGADHPFWKCPLLHLNFSKHRVLCRFNYSKFQERAFSSRKRRKLNCLKAMNFFRIKAWDFKRFGIFGTGIVSDDEDSSKGSFPESIEINEKNDQVVEAFHSLELDGAQQKKDEITQSCTSFDKSKLDHNCSKDKDFPSKLLDVMSVSNFDIFKESLKEYEEYFPLNNVSFVVEFCNQNIMQNMKKKNLLKKRALSLWAVKSPLIQRTQKEDLGSGSLRDRSSGNISSRRVAQNEKPSVFKSGKTQSKAFSIKTKQKEKKLHNLLKK